MANEITLQQLAELLPALQRCPLHPEAIILPWYSLRICCLYEALDQIRTGQTDNPQAVADAATQPIDPRIKIRPRLSKPLKQQGG